MREAEAAGIYPDGTVRFVLVYERAKSEVRLCDGVSALNLEQRTGIAARVWLLLAAADAVSDEPLVVEYLLHRPDA